MLKLPFRPAYIQRYAVTTLLDTAFSVTHSRVEYCLRPSILCSIIGQVDKNRVLLQPLLFKERFQFTDVLIDIGDHPVEIGWYVRILVLAAIGVRVLFRYLFRHVRRIRWKVKEEWFLLPGT